MIRRNKTGPVGAVGGLGLSQCGVNVPDSFMVLHSVRFTLLLSCINVSSAVHMRYCEYKSE